MIPWRSIRISHAERKNFSNERIYIVNETRFAGNEFSRCDLRKISFANRILSKRKRSNNPRRFCFRETPQDRLCKTSRYARARILVPRSRHFPLILSIVPSVRNSGKRSRIIPPATSSHNRAKLPEREIREREPKNREGILSTTSLQIVFRRIEAIPYPKVDSLRSETPKKDREDGSWRGRKYAFEFNNFFSRIDYFPRAPQRSNYLRDERESDNYTLHGNSSRSPPRNSNCWKGWIRPMARSRAKTIACKSNQSFPLREISFSIPFREENFSSRRT